MCLLVCLLAMLGDIKTIENVRVLFQLWKVGKITTKFDMTFSVAILTLFEISLCKLRFVIERKGYIGKGWCLDPHKLTMYVYVYTGVR